MAVQKHQISQSDDDRDPVWAAVRVVTSEEQMSFKAKDKRVWLNRFTSCFSTVMPYTMT